MQQHDARSLDGFLRTRYTRLLMGCIGRFRISPMAATASRPPFGRPFRALSWADPAYPVRLPDTASRQPTPRAAVRLYTAGTTPQRPLRFRFEFIEGVPGDRSRGFCRAPRRSAMPRRMQAHTSIDMRKRGYRGVIQHGLSSTETSTQGRSTTITSTRIWSQTSANSLRSWVSRRRPGMQSRMTGCHVLRGCTI